MIKAGIILFILSIFFVVIGAIFIIGSEDAVDILDPYICGDNEDLVRTSTPTGRPNEQSIGFYCEKEDGGERVSADGKMMLAFGALFIPMLFSILLMIIGSARGANDNMQADALQAQFAEQFGNSTATTYSISTSTNTHDVDAVIATVLDNFKEVNSTQQLTLKEKLEQLREAYDAGLISYEEFELRKDRVLDEIAED